MTPPTVLDYARHYNLTIDHCAIFTHQLALDINAASTKAEELSEDTSTQYVSPKRLGALPTPKNALKGDVLQNSPTQSPMLKQTVDKQTEKCQEELSYAIESLTRPRKHVRELYVDKPLLSIGGGDVRKDVNRIKRGIDIKSLLQKFSVSHQQHESEERSIDTSWEQDVKLGTQSVRNELRRERLQLSPESSKITTELLGNSYEKELNSGLRVPFWGLSIKRWVDLLSPIPALKSYAEHQERISAFRDDDVSELTAQNTNSDMTSGEATDTKQYQEASGRDINEGMHRTLIDNTSYTGTVSAHLDPESSLSPDTEQLNLFELQPFEKIEHKRRKLLAQSQKAIQAALAMPTMPQPKGNGVGDQVRSSVEQTLSEDNLTLVKHQSESDHRLLDERESNEYNETARWITQFLTDNLQECSVEATKSKERPDKIIARTPLRVTRDSFRESSILLLEKMLNEQASNSTITHKTDPSMNWNTFRTHDLGNIMAEAIDGGSDDLQQAIKTNPVSPTGDYLLQCNAGNSGFKDYGVIKFDTTLFCSTTGDYDASTNCQTTFLPWTLNTAKESCEAECGESTPKALSHSNRSVVGNDEQSIETMKLSLPRTDSPLQSSAFSAPTSLAALLYLRGKVVACNKLLPPTTPLDSGKDSINSEQFCGSSQEPSPSPSAILESPNCDKAPHSPKKVESTVIQKLSWPRTIVVNNHLLQSQPELVARCDSLGNGLLTTIYRDFKAIDGIVPDLILGPKSCLVFSNNQAFQQRHLPGQKRTTTSDAYNRILTLSRKYELVVLLVAWPDGAIANPNPINELSALFSSTSISTGGRIKPILIPYASAVDLRRTTEAWGWTSICKYAFPTTCSVGIPSPFNDVHFIQDETIWELFLCRAGLSVLAAQIILTTLSAQHPVASSSSDGQESDAVDRAGLARFVHMDLADRLVLFGEVVGRRAIEQVSIAIDNDRN